MLNIESVDEIPLSLIEGFKSRRDAVRVIKWQMCQIARSEGYIDVLDGRSTEDLLEPRLRLYSWIRELDKCVAVHITLEFADIMTKLLLDLFAMPGAQLGEWNSWPVTFEGKEFLVWLRVRTIDGERIAELLHNESYILKYT